MARVLLVDDDTGVQTTVGAILRLAGHQVLAEGTAQRSADAARTFHPDVALVDLQLPDASGLDVIAGLRALQPSVRCLVVTGFGDLSSAVEAIRLGVCDYLQKPIFEEDILAAVSRAVKSPDNDNLEGAEAPIPHDLVRWAEAIVRLMSSPSDAKTLDAFSRIVGISTGTFRNWCRTAQLSSRRSLQFARGLRAVWLRQIDGSTRPQKYLDIVDLRTLSKFLLASGGMRDRLPPSVEEFLQQQKYVDVEAVSAIRRALNDSGHPLSSATLSRLSRDAADVSPKNDGTRN